MKRFNVWNKEEVDNAFNECNRDESVMKLLLDFNYDAWKFSFDYSISIESAYSIVESNYRK